MSPDSQKQLAAAIGPRAPKEPADIGSFYARLITQGSPLDIARQVYVDRQQFAPAEMPPEPRLSDPDFLPRFAKGATVPEHLAKEMPVFLAAHAAYRLALSDNERRLRATMDAQLKLAASEDENDRRKASALGRWHIEHWGVADVPKPAPAGLDQPFEQTIKTAVRRRVR